MDGSRDCHTEWISQRSGNTIQHPAYVESKKKWYKWIYSQNRKRLTNLENELMTAGHTAILKMDSQQGHTVHHWGLWSALYDSLDGRGVWGRMDTWMHLPMQETEEMQVWSLGRDDPLEEDMTTHCSILAWRIPWTEEPGGLQSMGLQRVRHNWRDLACMHDWVLLLFIWNYHNTVNRLYPNMK